MAFSQSWRQDGWQPPNSGTDYATADGMVYDPPTLPSTTSMQQTTMPPPYSLSTPYGESPVVPMSASPYGRHGHFADYQPCFQAPLIPASYANQTPLQHSQRPVAPLTPPLEENRSMHHHDERTTQTVKSNVRRSPRRSVPVVKSEASNENREIKDCPKYCKEDGTLQYVSDDPVDRFLRAVENMPGRLKATAAGPQSMPSPASDEDLPRPQPKKANHQCKICGKSCTQKAQLTIHMRSHTGEKPHQCCICGKWVSQPGNLKAHMRKHTGEKPYRCTYCDATFAANGSRKVHERNLHEGAPKIECPMPGCISAFTTIGNMKVHLNKAHGEAIMDLEEMIKSLSIPEDDLPFVKKMKIIYKNSNRGIKGRGKDDEHMKQMAKRHKEDMRKREQAMPISPSASPPTQGLRTYYDQREQQDHYTTRTHPAQQDQAYMQQLPSHQAQPIFPNIPQPMSQYMVWAPGQYQ